MFMFMFFLFANQCFNIYVNHQQEMAYALSDKMKIIDLG